MSEWWTYRPSDFLMFSPRIYHRMIVAQNEAWWPLQPLLVVAGLLALALVARRLASGDATATSTTTARTPAAAPASDGQAGALARALLLAAAAAWVLVAWDFLWRRFAPINWGAQAYAIAFALQAVVLATTAASGQATLHADGLRRRVAAAIAAWALMGHPLLAAWLGGDWRRAELPGLVPEPTALLTLALLLSLRGRTTTARRLLVAAWALAIAWCAVAALSLLTLHSPLAWPVALIAPLALAAAVAHRPSPCSSSTRSLP